MILHLLALLSVAAAQQLVVYSSDYAHVSYNPSSSFYLLEEPGSSGCGSQFLLGDRSDGVVTLTFSAPATSFDWWGYQRSDGGKAYVCVDCTSSTTGGTLANYYNASTNGSEDPRLLYSQYGLSNTIHTVTITNVLDPEVNAYGQMTVDRFVLGGSDARVQAPVFGEGTEVVAVPMEFSYHVPLVLGGNEPAVEVLLDAGASGAWVVWEGCTETQCEGHNYYVPSTTDFYNFSIQDTEVYGSGGPANTLGSWRVNDSLSFSSLLIPQTTFGAAYSLPSGGESLDGNFGVAKAYYPSSCGAAYSNFVENMYVQGVISDPVLAFYQLTSEDDVPEGVGSVAEIGGLDANKFTGEMDWIQMSFASMWTSPLSQRLVQPSPTSPQTDATANFSHPAMTFDTGDPGLLGLPHDDWVVLMALLGAQGPDGEGDYLIPCGAEMSWDFWGSQGRVYTFALADGTTDDGEGFCSPLANDAGDTTNWITGAPFLDQYYVALHYEANMMGFGTRNLCASAASVSPYVST